MLRRARVLLAVAMLLQWGCDGGSTEPNGQESLLDVMPMCQAGCVETDPSPSYPGYFLGSEASHFVCLDGAHTDADLDGLSDYCEKLLAGRFAPELWWRYPEDNIGNEPRWVAQPIDSGRVRLAYLPAYYKDWGGQTMLCNIPFAHSLCLPHNGDAEVITLDVYYNAAKQHWILDRALLSGHGVNYLYQRGVKAYPIQFTYPTKPGGYPRVWIARGKHANYPDETTCDDGSYFHTDTCEGNNTATRLFASATRNLGSRDAPFADCVASVNPSYAYYGAGRTECYWTSKSFRGWVPDSVGGGQSGTYSTILTGLGF